MNALAKNEVAPDLAVQRATILSAQEVADPNNVYPHWVQMAWSGSGDNRRCWHWDGFIFGKRCMSVVWVRHKGYVAWAAGKKVIFDDGIDAFKTLAAAQDAAAEIATELPFAIVAMLENISGFHQWWHTVLEPRAAVVVAGIVSFVGWALDASDVVRAERQAIIDSAQASIEAFNAKYSAKGRR